MSTTITFTLTPDEQRQLLNMPISARWLKKPAAIRGIVILLVCEIFLIFTAVSNINQRQTTTGIAMLAAAGMFPYFILVTTVLGKAMRKQQLQRQPQMTWTVDEAGIALALGSGETQTAWRTVDSIVRERGFISVWLSGNRVWRIPERATDNGAIFVDNLERLRSENNGGATAKVRNSTYSVTFLFSQKEFVAMAAFLGGGRKKTKSGKSTKRGSMFMAQRWPHVLFGVAIGLMLEVFFVFAQQLPAAVEWILLLTIFATIYIVVGVMLVQALRKSKTQAVSQIPWMTIQGLMAVTLLPAGLLLSWDDGACRIGWGDITEIHGENDILFSGEGAGIMAIPASAFLSDIDRGSFLNAAEQYRQGETPAETTGVWPPAPK